MKKIIFLGVIAVLITGGSLFAQQKNEIINTKQEIYVPVMTKEQLSEQKNKERIKQAELKKNEIAPVEKNTTILPESNNQLETIENSGKTSIANESQTNNTTLEMQTHKQPLNIIETEKKESEKPDKK